MKYSELFIKKESESTILIRFPNGTEFVSSSDFKAYNRFPGVVCIKSLSDPNVSFEVDLDHLQVDDGSGVASFSDVTEAVTELNQFIGNFNTGGSASEIEAEYNAEKMTIQEALDAIDNKAGQAGALAAQANARTGASIPVDAQAGALSIREELSRVESIASGAKVGLTFTDTAQLEEWLAGNYQRPDGKRPTDLQTGWDLYTLPPEEPDYWWDGTGIQELDTKTDLSDYYTIEETNKRFSLPCVFVEKIGINSLIYPKYFRHYKNLKVEEVVVAGNAVGASFTVSGVNYNETTLKQAVVPAGEDLVFNDIGIAAGCDTGSITVAFSITDI
jgi:hypothetical protein